MTTSQSRSQGPAKSIFGASKRIVTLLVCMVETRLRLAVVELQEEKTNLIHLLMMVGITLICTVFGLMSLLLLIFWAVDPAYRVMALGISTGVLLLMAVIGTFWILAKVRRSTLFAETRKQLAVDRAALEGQ